MFAALLVLILAQTAPPHSSQPSVSVVVSRRQGMPVGRGIQLADAITQALKHDGLEVALTPSESASALGQLGVLDTATCKGESACVARLATRLHTRVVVGIDLAQVVDQLAVHLVGVPAERAVALADSAFVVDQVDPTALGAQLAPFVRQLQTAMAALPPENTAPRDANLLPPMTAENPVQAALRSEPKSRLPRYLAGGAAVGFAAASVGFLAAGLHQKGRLSDSEHRTDGVVTSSLTETQARSLRDVANRDLSLSLISGVVAAGLSGLTAYLWTDR